MYGTITSKLQKLFFINLFHSNKTKLKSLPDKCCCLITYCLMTNWCLNCSNRLFPFLNTQYMTNSTIVSRVKMEYGWNFSISGLKMMMKSGLEKIFLKFLHVLTMSFHYWICTFDQNSVIKRLKLHPYYILTGDTMVEFVIFCVLSM